MAAFRSCERLAGCRGGIVVVTLLAGARSATDANFYGVISHDSMIATFSVVFAAIIAGARCGLPAVLA